MREDTRLLADTKFYSAGHKISMCDTCRYFVTLLTTDDDEHSLP